MTKDDSQQIAVAALKIRGLLRRDQPSEALQVCLDLEKQALRSEELSTLRLASLLSLFELLHKLEATDLRQKTAEEFRLLNRASGLQIMVCGGIAANASRCGSAMWRKFGPEAATAVESVADLMAADDFTARKIIEGNAAGV